MNSELSKFIEEGLKAGSVQPGSQKTKAKDISSENSQPEITSGMVWKGLFAFTIALSALFWILTAESAQKTDQLTKEFKLSNTSSKFHNNYVNQTQNNTFQLQNNTLIQISQQLQNQSSEEQSDQLDQSVYRKDGLVCVKSKPGKNYTFCHPDEPHDRKFQNVTVSINQTDQQISQSDQLNNETTNS